MKTITLEETQMAIVLQALQLMGSLSSSELSDMVSNGSPVVLEAFDASTYETREEFLSSNITILENLFQG